jgi:hypothetical protein
MPARSYVVPNDSRGQLAAACDLGFLSQQSIESGVLFACRQIKRLNVINRRRGGANSTKA